MNRNQGQWYFSTWFIIVMFVVFWPAGIALLILRNSGSKNAMFIGSTDKKKYIVAGIALIILGICFFGDNKLWGLLMMAGGGALLYYSKTLVDKAGRNRQYIDLIVNQREGSIDNIAGVCNISYDKCLKELKYLQTVGVLNNVEFDEVNRIVTLVEQPKIQEDAITRGLNTLAGIGQGSAEEVMCTCPGCGAKVALIKGTSTKCDYCDSPITAE